MWEGRGVLMACSIGERALVCWPRIDFVTGECRTGKGSRTNQQAAERERAVGCCGSEEFDGLASCAVSEFIGFDDTPASRAGREAHSNEPVARPLARIRRIGRSLAPRETLGRQT